MCNFFSSEHAVVCVCIVAVIFETAIDFSYFICNQSNGLGDRVHPVEQVNWNDFKHFPRVIHIRQFSVPMTEIDETVCSKCFHSTERNDAKGLRDTRPSTRLTLT